MCYVLCFHAAEFATVEPGERYTALHQLLNEDVPEVSAQAFAPVLESQCNTIGRINKQVALQVCGSLKAHCPALVAGMRQKIQEASDISFERFLGKSEAGLDVFFPFDPYRLRHSSMFVASIYREWSGADVSDDESNADPEAAEAA